jgi:hypothetical protein
VTHFGFIAAAYAIGLAVPVVFTAAALIRLRAATRRLSAIDPRQRRAAVTGSAT